MRHPLTPPAGDGRTPAEYTYDMVASGAIYTTAMPPAAQAAPASAPNRYDTGQLSMAWFEAKTPIVTLPGGLTIEGCYDADGSPVCIELTGPDGYLYCCQEGLSGMWAGADLDIPAAALPALQQLLSSDILTALQHFTQEWVHAQQPEGKVA